MKARKRTLRHKDDVKVNCERAELVLLRCSVQQRKSPLTRTRKNTLTHSDQFVKSFFNSKRKVAFAVPSAESAAHLIVV